MVFESISDLILPIIILTLFVLVVEPIIIMALLGWLGFRKRTSFLTGLAMAQISEFSLILAALGVKNELIDDQVFGVIAVVGLITIAISSYLIIYGKKLYLYFSKYLNIFERKDITKSDYISEQKRPEVILFGLNRIGHSLIDALKEISQSYLVVDNDPEVIDEMKKDGLEYIFGDATDPELLDDLNFSNTKMVVSTIPDYEVNVDLITRLKKNNQRAVIIVVAHQIDEAKNLYEQGADFVLMPHFLGGDYGAKIIRQFGFNLERYYLKKRNHLEELDRRKRKKHEHPKPEQER
jgi:hypothetical protein